MIKFSMLWMKKKQVYYTCFKFGFETTGILACFAVI